MLCYRKRHFFYQCLKMIPLLFKVTFSRPCLRHTEAHPGHEPTSLRCLDVAHKLDTPVLVFSSVKIRGTTTQKCSFFSQSLKVMPKIVLPKPILSDSSLMTTLPSLPYPHKTSERVNQHKCSCLIVCAVREILCCVCFISCMISAFTFVKLYFLLLLLLR